MKMNFKQFIQYLSLKIVKDKNMKLTKDVLILLYKNIQEENQLSPLSRDEKRKKTKLYLKLHKYAQIIIECFEKEPQKYLTSVAKVLMDKIEEKDKKKKKKNADINK